MDKITKMAAKMCCFFIFCTAFCIMAESVIANTVDAERTKSEEQVKLEEKIEQERIAKEEKVAEKITGKK